MWHKLNPRHRTYVALCKRLPILGTYLIPAGICPILLITPQSPLNSCRSRSSHRTLHYTPVTRPKKRSDTVCHPKRHTRDPLRWVRVGDRSPTLNLLSRVNRIDYTYLIHLSLHTSNILARLSRPSSICSYVGILCARVVKSASKSCKSSKN